MTTRDTTAPLDTAKLGGFDVLLLALALVVLAAPNAIYAFAPGQRAFWLGQMATSALLLGTPLLLGIRPALVCYALIPLALLTPFVAAYAFATGYAPSLLALQVLREATVEELSNFSPAIIGGALVSAVLAACLIWLGRRCGRRRLALHRVVRTGGLLLALLALGKDILASGIETGSSILALRLEKMQPFAPVVLATRFALHPALIPDRSGVLARHTVTRQSAATGPEICVLVLGESARKRAYGLYNPQLDSTPRLRARDLIVFEHATSCGTATIQSVPILLTGRFPDQGEILPFRHLSLVEAFRLAGFKTGWFSTQEADGEISSFITAFSSGAEHRRFLNGRLERSRHRDPELKTDAALLPVLGEFTQGNPGPIFVVLQTLGNHAPYIRRYTSDFERWPVDEADRRTMWRWMPPFDEHQRQALEHAYLNSVYYTDWVLDQLIGQLAERGGISSLIFIGDHGENDASAPLMPAGHAVATDDVVDIPFFIWLSPELRAARPEADRALRANAARRVSAQDVFATVSALHGLETPAADPARNLASTDYREQVRHILTLDGKILPWPPTVADRR